MCSVSRVTVGCGVGPGGRLGVGVVIGMDRGSSVLVIHGVDVTRLGSPGLA